MKLFILRHLVISIVVIWVVKFFNQLERLYLHVGGIHNWSFVQLFTSTAILLLFTSERQYYSTPSRSDATLENSQGPRAKLKEIAWLAMAKWIYTIPFIIVRRVGLLWSQQDFEWRWSVPLFKCLIVLEFSFILFDLCLLITFFQFYYELCTYCNILDIYLSQNLNFVNYVLFYMKLLNYLFFSMFGSVLESCELTGVCLLLPWLIKWK